MKIFTVLLFCFLAFSVYAEDLPVKPISKLKGYDQAILRQDGIIKKQDMILYGAVIEGTHYVSECKVNRPCEDVILPSYSIAKSILAGLTLMRLEKLFPGAKESLVSDYISSCAQSGWHGVTFSHLLNMESGHYKKGTTYGDEDKITDWLLLPTIKEKTEDTCNRYVKQLAPGEKFVYRTVDTGLLSVAMQAFWQEKTGNPSADYYTDLLQPIWDDLGLKKMTVERMEGRIPFAGTGLFFTRSDIMKVAKALNSKSSILYDHLDQNMLIAAMQGSPRKVGLSADTRSQTYKHGFWGFNAGAYLKCSTDLWVPFMSGYGGKTVVLLPSGDIYYYFSDGGVYRFADVIAEFHRHRPICKGDA
ncbi:hypothetical protein QGN29_01185 [Temperatibacter marinus]|uniref:Beta-lactamase-related domain-containing protein n=1 Tax=Temperatibacter marinus TaxID=1456591 RepID=A0AA52H9W6_9PROT|nr:hypothetical protein [Temperatibacter marinus]WND02977.1 hypothetical protein QGN29_01185 [Temperatibacter marinus]